MFHRKTIYEGKKCMKSQNIVKGLLLILAVALMPALALGTVTSVTINSPTSGAPAYIRTIGTEAERRVNVNYTVLFTSTTDAWGRQIILMQGIGAPYETSTGMQGQSAPSTLSLTQTESWPAVTDTPEGLYNVRVNARQPNTGGPTTATNSNAIMVDNTAPTSTILTPSDGDIICVGTLVSITGTADDPISGGVASGIASVAVTVDSTSLTVTGTTSWSAEWTPDTPGIYTITSVATDNAGNIQSTETSISVEVVECEECEWIKETAWADGYPYNDEDGGNWATYTPYIADSIVTLYAGQEMDAGTVEFSTLVNGEVTITITLNTGWRFEDVEENVKIQDYEFAPSGNPKPGQFDHKGNADQEEDSFEITVPPNNFYGVHVNVEWEDCEEEEVI